ncbi:hypothetical protein ABH931_000505 [Streptacidiphilus sp. MAP12-33]|uniref:hypothetical protein n=1 Tax=Streptacidiphilus sp. MAP12-33 TaxID=3156266 RepID=UPI003513279E
MTTHLRRVAAAALCAGAALALTACSSSAGSPATAGAPVGAGSSTSSAPDPTAGLPTGTKLAAYLLPGKAVPSLKADNQAGVNSGDAYLEPSTKAVAKAEACQLLGGTGWMTASGIGPASSAGNDFMNSYGVEYYQQLDVFEGARATQDFAALKKVLTECKAYPASSNGSKYTMHVKLKTLTGLGDEAVEAVMTSPDLQGGETLVAIREGRLVVTTSYNDQSGTGAKAVTLARELLKKVPASAAS